MLSLIRQKTSENKFVTGWIDPAVSQSLLLYPVLPFFMFACRKERQLQNKNG